MQISSYLPSTLLQSLKKKNAKKKIAYVKSFIFPKTEQQLK
jgi:hypothetical protein